MPTIESMLTAAAEIAASAPPRLLTLPQIWTMVGIPKWDRK
jgi:hypothetical protein